MGQTQAPIPEVQESNITIQQILKQSLKPTGELDLSHQENLFDKCLALSKAPQCEFKILNLGHNIVRQKISTTIGQIKFRRLQSLQIDHCQLTCECLEEIFKASLNSLCFLYLNNNSIKKKGAKVLGKYNLCFMKTLDLSYNQLADEAMYWLAKGSFIELNTLNLRNNKITHEGVKYLADAQWPVLIYLNVRQNEGINITNKVIVQNMHFKTKLKGFRIQV